ncbi:MAG: hypothetical protein HY064_05860 [Bacteroidetes bacterium]|nr:hypothetical protein [Bacteroidota bacterium]
MKYALLLTPFLFFICIDSCKYDKANPIPGCTAANSSWSHSVNSIVQSKCAVSGCHVNGAYTGDFTTWGGVKMRVDDGTFKSRVFDLHVMPPAASPQLTSEEYQSLKCWYDAGAPNN